MAEEFRTLDEALELAFKGKRGKGVGEGSKIKFMSTKEVLEEYGKPLSELNDEVEFKKFWKWLIGRTKTGTAQGHAQNIRRFIEVSKPHKNYFNILWEDNMRVLTTIDEVGSKIGAGNLAKASNMEGYIKSINEAVVGLHKEAIKVPKTAWRSRSLKNFILMQSSSGPRMTELINLVSKHGYDSEMQTLFGVSTKGPTPANIDYDLGEFHGKVIEDQTTIAKSKNYEFIEDLHKQSRGKLKKFHDIWPYGQDTLSKQVKNYLKPIFEKNNVKWVEFNPNTSKKIEYDFKTKYLRNQFVKMAVLTSKNEMSADRMIGHKGSSTKVRSYPGTTDISAAEARALHVKGESPFTTRGQDLDTFWGRNFARTQGHNPLELAKKMGVDLSNTDFVNNYKPSTNKEIQYTKKVFKNVNTDINFNNQIDSTVDIKIDPTKKVVTEPPIIIHTDDIISDKPIIKPLSKTEIINRELDILNEEFSAEGIEKRERLAARKGIGQDLQEATPAEIKKVAAETGVDINTPSGKTKISSILRKIGRKLPFVAIPLGTYAAYTTLSRPAEAFEAPEGGDLASLFGFKTGEERQKARAAYQQFETLPFVPFFIPPAEDIFPTEEEKKLEEEQTSRQMSALFTGA